MPKETYICVAVDVAPPTDGEFVGRSLDDWQRRHRGIVPTSPNTRSSCRWVQHQGRPHYIQVMTLTIRPKTEGGRS